MADENDRTETSEANTPETEATESGAPESGETEPTTAETPEEPVAAADEPDEAEARAAPRRRRAARRASRRDAPAAEKPRRAARRAAAEKPAKDGATPTVVRAHAKYVRSSARKARLVCDHIRGKSVEEARAILAYTPRHVARDWSKLLESAVANAEHNHELDGDDLVIKAVHADEGPTLKRFRPRAMGRATPIRKRTSHLTILLAPKE
jgi:ribosomal protein L22